MKNIIYRITHYEKRKSDYLVLCCIPFVCCALASGLELSLGEKPSFSVLAMTLIFVLIGLDGRYHRQHIRDEKAGVDPHAKHDA